MEADFRVDSIFVDEGLGEMFAKCYDNVYGDEFEKYLGSPNTEEGRQNALTILEDSTYTMTDELRNEFISTFGLDDYGQEIIDVDEEDDFYDDNEDEVVESFSLREALNQIDINTDNKYDLLNLYESCNLKEDEKRALANIVYDQEDPSVIYDTLNNRFISGEEIGMPERVKDGVIHNELEESKIDDYNGDDLKFIGNAQVIKFSDLPNIGERFKSGIVTSINKIGYEDGYMIYDVGVTEPDSLEGFAEFDYDTAHWLFAIKGFNESVMIPETVPTQYKKWDMNESKSIKESNKIAYGNEKYKGYMIRQDRKYGGYNVYDKEDEMEDSGFTTIDKAKEFIDSLEESKSIKESLDKDLISVWLDEHEEAREDFINWVSEHPHLYNDLLRFCKVSDKSVIDKVKENRSKSIKESFPRNIDLDQVVMQVANLVDDKALGDDWIEVFPTRDASPSAAGEYFIPLEITGPDDVTKKATFRTRNGRVEVAFLNGSEAMCDSAESIARFIAGEFGLNIGEEGYTTIKPIKESSLTHSPLSTAGPLPYAVKLLYQMDKFVMDVYDNEGWLMYGVPDGEFEETTADEAMQNYTEHTWLIEDGNSPDGVNWDDFNDFIDIFKRVTKSRDYDQKERNEIIDEADTLVREYAKYKD